jgi:hypothetical protein
MPDACHNVLLLAERVHRVTLVPRSEVSAQGCPLPHAHAS